MSCTPSIISLTYIFTHVLNEMTMKKDLYLALRTTLGQSTQLRWIDWQKGQFTQKEQTSTLPLPVALLDLRTFNWKDSVMGQQEGMLNLYVDVYMPNLVTDQTSQSDDTSNSRSTSKGAPAQGAQGGGTQAGASPNQSTQESPPQHTLQVLDTLDEVYELLQGFQHKGLQGLSRMQEERLTSDMPSVLAYRLSFRSRIHQVPRDQAIQSHKILKWKAHGHISN